MHAFAHSLEHLLAELERVDLLIRAHVAAFRAAQTEDEQFRGLYVSEQQVDALLAAPLGMPAWLADDAPRRDRLEAHASLAQRTAARKRLALDAGIDLRLERLARLFALSELDVGI